MPEGAIIFDRSYFDKPEWLNQSKDGGFGRGPAWLDLLALTNQKATTGFVRGIQLPLERGWCAYSKLALSQRWGRSQGWVTTTLTIWEKDGRIAFLKSDNETTIMHVVNFDSWQTGLAQLINPHREQVESRPRADREQVETEREKDRELSTVPRREGEGEGNAAPPRLITLEAVQKYFAENQSGYSADAVREQWLYYDALRDPQTGEWQKPRGNTGAMVRITDWRSEMANALQRFAEKSAGPARANGGNGLSANVQAIQDQTTRRTLTAELNTLEDEVHQDRVGNQPSDPEKKSRLKKLRADLAALQPEVAA